MSAKHIEPVWHIELAVMIAIVLQIFLAEQLTVLPKFLIAVLEVLLLIGLRYSQSTAAEQRSRPRHLISLSLTGIVTIANLTSLWLVCQYLIEGSLHLTGKQLIISAISIYITNIIIFGLWYWLLDGGGPSGRDMKKPQIDFMFPQKNSSYSSAVQTEWKSTYFDYLYISITTATAFSAADALPLTHRAKLLMGIQAMTGLLTIAIVASRAIAVLG